MAGALAADHQVAIPSLAQPAPSSGSPQVEQGALAHLRVGAFGAHEAEGEVVLVAAGRGAPVNLGRIPPRSQNMGAEMG